MDPDLGIIGIIDGIIRIYMKKLIIKNDILRTKSEMVNSVEEANQIIKELQESIKEIPNSIGLAAIQIGIPKKVAYIKTGKEPLILINPELIEKEDEFVFIDESCLSLPGEFYRTKRYENIVIKNHIIEDNQLKERKEAYYFNPNDINAGDGLICIAVQHELDHFDGVLINSYNIKFEPIKKEAKIGRNEQCPCNSGKKYKKCCGKN